MNTLQSETAQEARGTEAEQEVNPYMESEMGRRQPRVRTGTPGRMRELAGDHKSLCVHVVQDDIFLSF